MERSLLWSGFAIGWAGWLIAALIPAEGERPRLPRAHFAFAAVLTLLVFLATLPEQPPFSAGQGWGRGFLIGGVAALLAAWAAARNPQLRAAASAAPLFLVLPAMAAAPLWLRESGPDSLTGIGLGWVSITLVLLASGRLPALTLGAGAVFAATLCAAGVLSLYRGGSAFEETRWLAAILTLAAAVPFLNLVTALPEGLLARIALKLPFSGFIARAAGAVLESDEARAAVARALKTVLGIALYLGLAWLLSVRLLTEPSLLYSAAIGIGAALLCAWNLRGPDADEESAPRLLALLVMAAALMAAFHLMAGMGVAAALMGAWLVGGFALSGAENRASASSGLLAALGFGAVFLIYRVVTARFGDELRGVGFSDNYAMIGFLLGLALPAGAAAVLLPGEPHAARSLARVALVGLMALGAPAALILLWGAKGLLALLFGMAAAAGLSRDNGSAARVAVVVIAIASALAAAQWLGFALPWSAMPRAEKIRLLAWGIGIGAVLLILSDYVGRVGRRTVPTAEPAP